MYMLSEAVHATGTCDQQIDTYTTVYTTMHSSHLLSKAVLPESSNQ